MENVVTLKLEDYQKLFLLNLKVKKLEEDKLRMDSNYNELATLYCRVKASELVYGYRMERLLEKDITLKALYDERLLYESDFYKAFDDISSFVTKEFFISIILAVANEKYQTWYKEYAVKQAEEAEKKQEEVTPLD